VGATSIQVSSELLDGMVLALIRQEDMYGYIITNRIASAVPISISTMYPVLRRLQKAGLLDTYDKSYQGRNRRYYRITPAGEKTLTTILGDWQEYKTSIDGILSPTGTAFLPGKESNNHDD
jgi:PadR family transcriptional regulator PadR